jgi:hypothetical protein
MDRLTRVFFVAILMAGAIGIPARARGADDGIIAVVNNEVITFKDLQDYIRQTFASLAAQGLPDDQV